MEMLAAREGQEPRLIVTFVVVPFVNELGESGSKVKAICCGPDGMLTTVDVWRLSLDWHFADGKWVSDFEEP